VNQQINLHQPIFRQQRALFSARIVLRIAGIWALALGVIWGLSLWRDGLLAGEQARLERNRDFAAAQLKELTGTAADPARSQQLEAEVATLSSQRAQKEGVLRVLMRGDLGGTTGFAPHMETLARRRIDGVWLTRVTLSAGGQEVSLGGRTLDAERLPEFLERLAADDEEGLRGARFGEVRLERADDGESLRFELNASSAQAAP
jgi:Tfp pilus assembly protein PilN